MSMLIHTLPAESGDCFILEIDDNLCILIDAGYPITYRNYLKPKLMELNRQGKVIDLFIVTHIDEDHIGGAIEFLADNGQYDHPNIITIKEIWFNGLLSLEPFMNHPMAIVPFDYQLLKAGIVKHLSKLNENAQTDISVGNSISFELLCKKYEYPLNSSFNGQPVVEKRNAWARSDINFSIDVASPRLVDLINLTSHLYREIYKLSGQKNILPPTESMMFIYQCIMIGHDTDLMTNIEPIMDSLCTDISQWNLGNDISCSKMTVPNLSSIGLVMQYKDKVLLFPGDTSLDFVVNLNTPPFLIKLSHHGSFQYNKILLSNDINCTYLLSTNSKKYNHPNLRLIASLLMKAGHKHLHMNYPIDKLSILSSQKQQTKYNFSISCGDLFIVE